VCPRVENYLLAHPTSIERFRWNPRLLRAPGCSFLLYLLGFTWRQREMIGKHKGLRYLSRPFFAECYDCSPPPPLFLYSHHYFVARLHEFVGFPGSVCNADNFRSAHVHILTFVYSALRIQLGLINPPNTNPVGSTRSLTFSLFLSFFLSSPSFSHAPPHVVW